VWGPFLSRPLAGAALALARGRMLDARYYLATWRGRLEGMRAPPLPAPGPLEAA
jgi:hypothetical protein